MTNEQLAILLEGILSELNYAIGESRELFDRPRIPERVHAPANLSCLGLGCNNPEHYDVVMVLPHMIELTPIEGLCDDISDRIKALRKD